MFNAGRDPGRHPDPCHGPNRDRDRGPSGGRGQTFPGRPPSNPRRTDLRHTAARSSARHRKGAGSSTRHATDTGFRPDTNTPPPIYSLARALGDEREPLWAQAVDQF